MARKKGKRTLKQKLSVVKKAPKSIDKIESTVSTPKSPLIENSQSNISEFFAYDYKMIYKDLLKTVVLSVVLIASLLGISFVIK